jgi:hypothetical protein
MTVNTRSEFSLNNFVSAVRTQNLARPTQFEVEIAQPGCIKKSTALRTVSLFCKSASLPQTRINTSRLQIFGPPIYAPVGVDYGGDNITLAFYVDQQLDVKAFFDEWVDGVVNRRSGIHEYSAFYTTSMKIKQLDLQRRVVYAANFQDVFPVSVNPLMLDYNSTGQVHELSVTFNYRRWTYETASYSDLQESSVATDSQNTNPKVDNQRGQPSKNKNRSKNRNIQSKSWKTSA